MGLIKWIKNRRKASEEPWESAENWRVEPLKREELDINNDAQRERYIRSCCEQMLEATQELDRATMEYRSVTEYLTDMEEIESLPKEERADINAYARKIASVKKEQKSAKGKIGSITDAQFKSMEKIEEEMPAALEKLVADEDYKSLVKQDLQKLEGEKMSEMFRKRDLSSRKSNAKGILIITAIASAVTIGMLLAFQNVLQMDVTWGYLITIAVTAVMLTIIFLTYSNASVEKKKVEKKINQLILLQNTVKIRYVNITTVLEYSYGKYKVNSSDELKYLWEKYLEEREERMLYEKAEAEVERLKEELLFELRRLRIKDPNIWLHQSESLINPKEMVENRHELIIRRQSMRKRIEYNTENRNAAKNEIADLVKTYPKYAKEILCIVSEYE